MWSGEITYRIGVTIISLLLGFFYLRQPLYFKALSSASWIYLIIILCFDLFVFINFPTPSYILTEALVVGIFAAIPEEIEFRGFIFGKIYEAVDRTKTNKWDILYPIIFVALLFSLAHFQNLAFRPLINTIRQMIQTFGMGILLSAIYLRTKNLLVPIITHFSVNFCVTILSDTPIPLLDGGGIPPMIKICLFYTVIAIIVLWKYEPTKNIGDLPTKSIIE